MKKGDYSGLLCCNLERGPVGHDAGKAEGSVIII